MKIPVIKKFINESEKSKYIIKEKMVVDGFTASLSKLYHKMNKKNKILKVGQKITTKSVPYGYFKYKKVIYPVYTDDASQQDLIYIDGEWIGGGNFNPSPIDEFIYEIDRRRKK